MEPIQTPITRNEDPGISYNKPQFRRVPTLRHLPFVTSLSDHNQPGFNLPISR